jgi:hypothetical protein
MQVVIADDRPKWQQVEDREMACFTRCSLFKKCSNRHGFDCRHLGGDIVPKINNRGGSREKEKSRHRKGKRRRV